MTIRDLIDAHLAKLPSLCYTVLEGNEPGSRIVAIRAGEHGYYVTDLDSSGLMFEQASEIVKGLNARLGVTSSQQEAMRVGSMFGWHVPGADTDCYVTH